MKLPDDYRPYIDKYFLRAKKVLEAENLNPFVRAQVFIRKGPGFVAGMNDAVDIIKSYTNILYQTEGDIYTLHDGFEYQSGETQMVIEARIQDIVELETMYLGVLSAATTKLNDKIDIDLKQVTKNMRSVVNVANGRPVSYFGARHWSFDMDSAITKAAYDGGAVSCSTDAGAATFGGKGMGTIPHALENIMAWKYGYKNAVVESLKAFDRVFDPSIPRVGLIDYANREIDDSLQSAKELGSKLYGVRVDTCGENIAQGALINSDFESAWSLFGKDIIVPGKDKQFWFGNGVTVSGVFALRQALNNEGCNNVKIMLSSGFGNPKKVEAFTRAEELIGIKLYDALGVGGVFESRAATMDIVAVGDGLGSLKPMAKIGRTYKPNSMLAKII